MLEFFYEIFKFLRRELVASFPWSHIDYHIMRRLPFFIFMIFLFLSGCTTLTVAELEEKYETQRPVIKSYFASDTIRNGDVWKVYFSAHDPDGDMEFIVTTIDQTGVIYDTELMIIEKEDRETITGYIYLNIPTRGIWFERIKLTLSILDKAEHKSNKVVFPLYICNKMSQPLPPEFGEEFNRPLGWIPTRLISPHYQYLEDPEIMGHPDSYRGIWD